VSTPKPFTWWAVLSKQNSCYHLIKLMLSFF